MKFDLKTAAILLAIVIGGLFAYEQIQKRLPDTWEEEEDEG